ncbi:Wax ester synthase/diacylglycerol acyltransferase 11 [Linum perenne]
MNCKISRESLIDDEPLSPSGRLFLRPEIGTIIHTVVGVENFVETDAIKEMIRTSMMIQHPRFCSVLVGDRWRRTEVDIDRHVVVVDTAKWRRRNDAGDDADHQRTVNAYLADLAVSSPLSLDKPLWEIHILPVEMCAVFRVHHAMGDGISLMSMLLENCRKADDPEAVPTMVVAPPPPRSGGGGMWRRIAAGAADLVKMVVYSLVFCLAFVIKGLWVGDRETAVSGGAGVEMWPRKLATAKFLIGDMKTVKMAVAKATINDVLLSIIALGLSKYLDHRSPNALKEGQQLTGIAMVNLRKQPGLQEIANMMKSKSGARWGNKFGMILLPLKYCSRNEGLDDPLEIVRRTTKMVNRKKKSLEAYFSYHIGDMVMSLLGPKVASMCNYRLMCNTTFTISNMVGPKEDITIAGNPVRFIKVNTSSLPHALTMHMVSYAGRAEMQILVAKDIIPDPEFLAKCFEDSLLEMKIAAEKAQSR